MESVRKSARTTRGVPPLRNTEEGYEDSRTQTVGIKSPVRKMSIVQSASSDRRKQRIELETKKQKIDLYKRLGGSIIDMETEIEELTVDKEHCQKKMAELEAIPQNDKTSETANEFKRYSSNLSEIQLNLDKKMLKLERLRQKRKMEEQAIVDSAAVDKEAVDLDEQYLSSEDEKTVKKWDLKSAAKHKQTDSPLIKTTVDVGGTEMERIVADVSHNFGDNSEKDTIDRQMEWRGFDSVTLNNDSASGSDDDEVESKVSSHPKNDAVGLLVTALERLTKSQRQERVVVKTAVDYDLPTFSGKPEEWSTFKSQYDRSNIKHKFDDADNLVRLRKSLTGKALEAVKFMFNCAENVPQIIRTLKMEFGRPEHVIESLIKIAESTPNPDANKPETIILFARAVQSLVFSIQGHKNTDYLNNIYLLNKLTDKLPVSLRREWILWYRGDPRRQKNMSSFCDWISTQKELACEMSKVKPADGGGVAKQQEFRPRRGPGTTAVGVTEPEEKKDAAVEEKQACHLCGKTNHQIGKCFGFKKRTVAERWELVKKQRLCYGCLKGDHQINKCQTSSECGKDGCKRHHHRLLHEDKVAAVNNNKTQDKAEVMERDDGGVNANGIIKGADGPLGVVPVRVRGPNGVRRTYALLDSGATSSFIDGNLAAELGFEVEGQREYQVRGFFGNTTRQVMQQVSFDIKGDFHGAQYSKLHHVNAPADNLGFTPYSCDVVELKRRWPHLKGMKMDNLTNAVIRIVIGEDNGALTIHRKYLYKDDNAPVAKRTKLGWYIGGKIQEADGHGLGNCITGGDDYLHQLIKSSFSLDYLGIRKLPEKEKGSSIEDRKALEILTTTYRKEGSKCEVGLLWRSKEDVLPPSKEMALDRLLKIEKKMRREPQFAEAYRAKFVEYMNKGYISKVLPSVSGSPPHTWYMPHFGVYNPNKPGKLRLVFDAAAEVKGKSLNHFLMTGPDLIRPITEVLWNFRRHRIAISGDIEDMFHRVSMKDDDRCAQRFLWRDGNEEQQPEEYQMNVLVFGATSSPSSAIFVKNRNAQEYQDIFPEAYRAITEDFFVDDALTGADTEEEAVELFRQVTWINQQGNFNVKKWTSNSAHVISKIPEDFRAQDARSFSEKSGVIPTERVLGLWWDPTEDTFSFRANYHRVKPEIMQGKRPTKGEMCQLVMSLYDPIGFINNFKIKGMMILQRTWRDNVGWDDEVSDDTYEHWKTWVKAIPGIENLRIPRCYNQDLLHAESVELHTMVDASTEGYCAISYLRVTVNSNVTVSMVASKVRVAPLKKSTIPRLELMAAVLGTRLAVAIEDGVRIKIGARHFWSDSSTVLSWLRTETSRFKEFVANRVGEIQEATNATEWHWIPTKLNVADEGTRQQMQEELSSNSRWLTGPEFLLREKDEWPKEKKSEDFSIYLSVGKEEREVPSTDTKLEFGLDCHRFSSFHRMIRVAGAVVAAQKWWLHKKDTMAPWKIEPELDCSKKRILREHLKSYITAADVITGELLVIRKVQMEAFPEEMDKMVAGLEVGKKSPLFKLSPVLDSNGIIRVKGRIGNATASEDVKQPIILPSKHYFTELLILSEHRRSLHQGRDTVFNNLRQKYWICGGRNAVNIAVRHCPECKLQKVKPVIPEMGSLPHYRLFSYQPPFTFTGVDFFGPVEVTVCRHREKRWVSLFVCMVTRSVHMEVAHGLSTDDMMMVLSRFMDTRGRPSHIYSDNGTNFVGAARELKEALKLVDFSKLMQCEKFNGTIWSFIPPSAPHMGGAWERLVRTVKKALTAVLKERRPKDQTFLTAVKAVENVVNSRPLTFVSSDSADPDALTPNHFLRGRADVGTSPVAILDDSDEFSRRQWKVAQAIANHFWEKWTKGYLPDLLKRQKWHEKEEPVRIGDLVFIVDDQQPRNVWLRAVVSAVFPGKDGQVRVVEVTTRDYKTKWTSMYRRPVSKICKLGLSMDAGAFTPSSGAGNVAEEEDGAV